MAALIMTENADYLYNNQLGIKWSLVKQLEDYQWSSSSLYLTVESRYSFMTENIMASYDGRFVLLVLDEGRRK
ncbi:hypothetical protein MYP_856 [Sporocytophaga myxococcoides]|uniref:Uncharacterized protein n=1 Tax=Sporocytophaga myxococcoides TaxID=153721 RepID=A0A098LB09_9BACT|nr:hypothetical protein [Sporocytophaga myxococcoides]GAL83629.1 hypothetical protein MYP_856 [Sporocytophaga myxococcoides]